MDLNNQKKKETLNIEEKPARILIVGSGTMGTGIAQAFAQKGFRVALAGRSQASLEKGLTLIAASLKEGLEKGVFTENETEKIKRNIKGLTGERELVAENQSKLVIETISEDFEAKRDLLIKLDSLFPASTILATNTSSLDAEALASHLSNPERFIWAHFFYPAQRNRIVEVSSLSQTAAETVEKTIDILQQAGRETVRLKKYRRAGAANVILIGLILEALRLIEEGYEAWLIDEASKLAFGTSFGLISVLQFIGPETALATANSFSASQDPADPIFLAYNNFFSFPPRFQNLLKIENKKALSIFLMKEKVEAGRDRSLDPLVLELARQRFQAVAFMTSSEVVEAGLLEPAACDRLCQLAFGWPDGPFNLMNRLGLEASLRLVTEKMELSHRQEINFPIPRNLIERAQRNESWPLS